ERGVDVLDLEADVEQPWALLVDPAGHAGIGPLSLQELDVRLSHRQHGQARLADLLLVLEGQAERVSHEVDGRLERAHGYGDVLHSLDLHDSILSRAGEDPMLSWALPSVKSVICSWRRRLLTCTARRRRIPVQMKVSFFETARYTPPEALPPEWP